MATSTPGETFHRDPASLVQEGLLPLSDPPHPGLIASQPSLPESHSCIQVSRQRQVAVNTVLMRSLQVGFRRNAAWLAI